MYLNHLVGQKITTISANVGGRTDVRTDGRSISSSLAAYPIIKFHRQTSS